MNTLRSLWSTIRVDAAVLVVIVVVLLQYPDQWFGLVCDILGVP